MAFRRSSTIRRRGGGWVFQSDHSITSDVAPESYALAIECLRQYGNYPLPSDD